MSLLSLDQIKTLYDDLRGRIEANEEGTFPDMSVGSLISDEKISNSSPYLYRPVINGVGNRAYSKLIGATIAFNQIIPNTSVAAGTYTWAGITSTFNTPANHVFLAETSTSEIDIRFRDSTTGLVGVAGKAVMAKQSTSSVNATIQGNGTATKDFYVMVFDLTLMFGSTIADYAYTLEQGEAGAGVAWLKSYGFFGKYAPYDAGSLISTKAEKKKVVGKNRLDPSTLGLYDATGTGIMRYGFAPILLTAGTYTISKASGSVITYITNVTDNYSVTQISSWPYSFTLAADAEIIIRTGNNSSTGFDLVDVQLEEGSTATTYTPYTSQEYDLGSDELRGLFKLDANNNIVADGDIKTPDGQITRNWEEITLTGAETFSAINDGGSYFFIETSLAYDATAWQADDIISNLADTALTGGRAGTARLYTQFNSGKKLRLTSSKSATSPFSTKEAFVNYLVAQYQAGNPVKILFKKATPTTEQGTPYIDPSIVYPNGTEEYIDTRTVPVPVGNETEYTEDLKGGLETILDTPSANGTYVLKATVSGGVATLGWVAE